MTPRDLKTVVECLLRAVMGTTMHEASPLQGCSHRALRRCVHSRQRDSTVPTARSHEVTACRD